MIRLISLAGLMCLAACSGGDGEGTSITVDSNSDNGAPASFKADGKTGAVSIDAPGFKLNVDMPRIALDANDFDMNGVHLYPGSTIGNLAIADGRQGGNDRVTLSFTSPAAADVVTRWFQDKLGGAGFTLRGDGTALNGTTNEGKPFSLKMTPEGEGRSSGTIVFTG